MIIYHDKHENARQVVRAVIYIRFSSKQQAESYSIEYQHEECLKYLEAKGYKFIKSYIDKAKTAKQTAGREALEEMLFDASRNQFDKIIVFSFSRSFRNTRDALNTNHELMSKHGIVIESVIEPIDLSSPHGKFSGTNLFAMHELQSDITAAHARAGMYIAAKQGYYLGGVLPFGYDVYETGEFTRGKPRKKYCIHEEEAEIVKEIFKMFLDGFSLNAIRDELILRDIRSKKTGEFMPSHTIGRMLKNEFYIGTRHYDVKGYDPLIMENAVPAIIDVQTFNDVQIKFNADKDKPKPRRTKRLYALTGKIECAKCGGHYVGSFAKDRRGGAVEGYARYICYQKNVYRKCDGTNIRQDILEEYCIKQIKKHILTPEKIKEIAAYIVSQTDGSPDMVKDEIETAEKRKRKVIDNIKDLKRQQLEADEAEKEVNAELIADYSKELAKLNEKLARLETLEQSVISVEMVEAFLNDCALNIDSPDPQIVKSVFDKLIEKIIIHDDKVEVFLFVFPFARVALNDATGCPYYALSVTYNRAEYSQYMWREKRKSGK